MRREERYGETLPWDRTQGLLHKQKLASISFMHADKLAQTKRVDKEKKER